MDSKRLKKNISYFTSWIGLHIGSLIIKAHGEVLKLVEGIIQRALIGIDLGQEAVVLQIIVVLGIGDIEVVNIKKITASS